VLRFNTSRLGSSHLDAYSLTGPFYYHKRPGAPPSLENCHSYRCVRPRLKRSYRCEHSSPPPTARFVMSIPFTLSRHWFALFTASNNEKKVVQHLQMKDIETFLPLYTTTRRWKNRTTARVQAPLFTGYVFARIARSETAKVLAIPMVYSIVGNKHGAVPLPDEEIEALRRGLASVDAQPHQYVQVGQRARIRSGPLEGLEGIVERVDDHLRVVLTIDLIMKSIAVRVNAEDIDICAPAK
jgi:transcription antitermination factor NusG